MAVRHIAQADLNGRLSIKNGQPPLQRPAHAIRQGHLQFPHLFAIAGVLDVLGQFLLQGTRKQGRKPLSFQCAVQSKALFCNGIGKTNDVIDQNHNAVGGALNQQPEPLSLLNQVVLNAFAVADVVHHPHLASVFQPAFSDVQMEQVAVAVV